MEHTELNNPKKSNCTACPECQGRGKRHRRLNKKARLQFQKTLEAFQQNQSQAPEQLPPIRPKGQPYPCSNCNGTGLIPSENPPPADTENYPHVAIIGGGIGGVALAIACLHRGIPFTLYERDHSFDSRSQGYGLTLQQASKAIQALGIDSLTEGVISTRHVVHSTDGNILGEWGIRKWKASEAQKPSTTNKRTNIHIARQALRHALLDQLPSHSTVKWNHQFLDYSENETDTTSINLRFQVAGEITHQKADLIVGADGIRSSVRKQLIPEEHSPLQYLGCIVILGICPLSQLNNLESPLLDSATVFQTANGNERIYMMPYDSDSIMWQLSFPMPEEQAKALSAKGTTALKQEACRRTQWHSPIPQIMAATKEAQISGYPVYDRALLQPQDLQPAHHLTLIGDAAHPMSPFKGQGANQAILDALSLARNISMGCRPLSEWRKIGLRQAALNEFESEMLARSATKVKDSAEAAEFLHSDIALHEGNEPRGRCLKRP